MFLCTAATALSLRADSKGEGPEMPSILQGQTARFVKRRVVRLGCLGPNTIKGNHFEVYMPSASWPPKKRDQTHVALTLFSEASRDTAASVLKERKKTPTTCAWRAT